LKAFTLIEVIIAVALSFVISAVAFSIASNTKHFISLSEQRNGFYYKASVAALESDGKNVYEMLKGFNIRNDAVIKDLKRDRFEKRSFTEYSTTENIDNNRITVTLNRIKIYDKHNSLNIYYPEIK